MPNNQIITACHIKLRVQEMTMNEKLTTIEVLIERANFNLVLLQLSMFLILLDFIMLYTSLQLGLNHLKTNKVALTH